MNRYCIKCHSKNVHEVVEGNEVFYDCPDCKTKSGRSFFDDGRVALTVENGYLKHQSVGALIRKGDSILLVKRRTYPYGYAIISGHMEYGETVDEALAREVLEETGLMIKSKKLLFSGDISGDQCRLGIDHHGWNFFQIEYDNQPIHTSSEHQFLGWYNVKELKSLELAFASKFLLTKIGLLEENDAK